MASTITADNGVTSGSAGIKTSADSTGVLALQSTTAGGVATTALSISNTQVVTYANQPVYTGGTANGVAYLNGSKVLTTGSALTFDGSNFSIGSTSVGTLTTKQSSEFKGISLVNFYSANEWALVHDGSDSLRFAYNGGGLNAGEKMRLNSSGNLGLGVTPSAWGTSSTYFKAIDIGQQASIAGLASGQQLSVSLNAYYNAGWKFASTATASASQYYQSAGQHIWQTAGTPASHTTGDAISFTQAMTLDASGNLGVATTSPKEKLHVNGGIITTGSYNGVSNGGAVIINYSAGGQILSLDPTVAWKTLDIGSSLTTFSISGSEKARIDSSGNLLVGTTTSAGGTTISTAFAAGQQSITVVKSAIAANTANNFYMQFNGSAGADGYINTNGSSVLTLTDVSDVRLKENIVDAIYGITTVMALRPVEYSWIGDDRRVKGFIAQEVKEVLPESVLIKDDSATGGLEDMHLLEMQTMIPVLVKAIQEQQAIIESLKARLDAANL